MLRRLLRKPQPLTLTPERAAEARENVASIKAIPHAELPDADARAALIELAQSGAEVYAYTPAASTAHTIWLRPAYRWQEGRMSCAEWTALYHAVVASIALADGALDGVADAQGGQR